MWKGNQEKVPEASFRRDFFKGVRAAVEDFGATFCGKVDREIIILKMKTDPLLGFYGSKTSITH